MSFEGLSDGDITRKYALGLAGIIKRVALFGVGEAGGNQSGQYEQY
ncbi:MAG: hypothetical protein JRF53_00525 [Deltaproteobacteria bacterium]|nr:hypothetical protein [Deltaproteobacteria bacterium]